MVVYCDEDSKIKQPVRKDMFRICALGKYFAGPRKIECRQIPDAITHFKSKKLVIAAKILSQREDWLSVAYAAADSETVADKLLANRPVHVLMQLQEFALWPLMRRVEMLGRHK